MGRASSSFFLIALVACGASGAEKPAAPPSNPALERACEEQRRTHSFDRGCMAVAMSSARTGECKRVGARVHVKVTFAPDGTVPEAVVDLVQPPEAGPEVSACVIAKFRELRMPPFSGAPVNVGKTIDQ